MQRVASDPAVSFMTTSERLKNRVFFTIMASVELAACFIILL